VAPPPPTTTPRQITDEDSGPWPSCSIVTGLGTFDLADAVEFIEGAASGVDRRLVRKLRAESSPTRRISTSTA
jgi:hypothetical protein